MIQSPPKLTMGFPGGTSGKEPACHFRRWKRPGVQSLDWKDLFEGGMATYSSILAWSIPWTEEPGRLWSMGLWRVRHDFSDLVCIKVKCSLWVWKSGSCVGLFATPWTIQSVEFSRPEYWSGQPFCFCNLEEARSKFWLLHLDVCLRPLSSSWTWKLLNRVWLFVTPETVLYSPWNSLGQNTRLGSLSLLQGIFPTQGLDPHLPHCRWILYQLSHREAQEFWSG